MLWSKWLGELVGTSTFPIEFEFWTFRLSCALINFVGHIPKFWILLRTRNERCILLLKNSVRFHSISSVISLLIVFVDPSDAEMVRVFNTEWFLVKRMQTLFCFSTFDGQQQCLKIVHAPVSEDIWFQRISPRLKKCKSPTPSICYVLSPFVVLSSTNDKALPLDSETRNLSIFILINLLILVHLK